MIINSIKIMPKLEIPLHMIDYYKASTSHYANWGRDQDFEDVYALHCGYNIPGTDQSHYQEIQELTRQFIFFSHIQEGERILDAGCGTGVVAFTVSHQYPSSHVLGVNLAPFQLETAAAAKKKNNILNVDFSLQHYEALGVRDRSFERILFCESFTHGIDKVQILQEARRILKPTGSITIGDIFLANETVRSYNNHRVQTVERGFKLAPLVTTPSMLQVLQENGFTGIRVLDISTQVSPSAQRMPNMLHYD